MRSFRFYPLVCALLILSAALGLAYGGGSAANGATTGLAEPNAVLQDGIYVQLNEVMPKPAAGEAAWVELYVGQNMNNMFLPIITRPEAPGFTQANQVAVPEAPLIATAAINLAGYQVSNETGQVYTLPGSLTSVPPNTYVVIVYDETGGPDDTDPTDGVIVLHTPSGMGDVFPDLQGQVGLYAPGALSPETIKDFVAWGGFDDLAGANAAAAGVWGLGQALSFENGFGDISQADLLEPDESAARHPAGGGGVTAWANYPAKTSRGAQNPAQPVTFITPENGASVDAATLSLSWRQAAGATAYHFQLDDNSDFSSPLIDLTTAETWHQPDPQLAAGMYYWRVNPLQGDQPTSWTLGFELDVFEFAAPPLAAVGLNAADAPSAPAAEKTLAIDRIRQNKDSRLLGLDGAPEGDPTTDLDENAWDAAAPCVELPCADTTKFSHGSAYCVRASIRMMASWYGGDLTMDRISYYVLQEWSGNTNAGTNDANPDNDLGHARGMFYPDEEDEGISWALNSTITTPGGKPAFSDIKTWIDANRPIMFRNPGHMMVINGYKEEDSTEYIHVLDPDQPPNFERWQVYSSQTIDGYWVGPTSGTAKSDEASVSTDSDGDGIMDFDEVKRFNLDPYDVDTDEDWVPDKKDMREYVFTAAGAFNNRGADWDLDGIRKELDVDNDNDGSPDGCEDNNYNGVFDGGGAGETDNFNAASNQACSPLFDILYPLKVEPVNAGDHTAPDKILVQVSTAVPAGWSLGLTAGDFTVEIGGVAANVLSIYPAADTYFLVVDPPVQAAAAFYDLNVSLTGSGTDTEATAVYYLPKNPNDEVIVLDRSGSMLADDKIGAAKNAGSAFVDYLNDGDYVGVVSFASSASTNYALTEITGDPIRTAAISAINGLTASGSTALGQGAEQGYGLLTAAAHADHDWSMVLLSDGWENVAPYWNDVKASINEAVVHTVALGEDADTGLLQSIAAEKHGNYFYVDVNPPVVAMTNGPTAANAPPLNFANTLPNRLADVYLSIGEHEQNLQRLFNENRYTGQSETQMFTVEIPDGLPEVIFHANWDDPLGHMVFAVFNSPSGAVAPDAEYMSDTHVQRRVLNPEGGIWEIAIRVLKPTQELHFSVSGKSSTTLIAAVGGDPAERTVGMPVPIYGILTDEKPIPGADVYAIISGQGIPSDPGTAAPEGVDAVSGTVFLQLFDDGTHGDIKADDGLYANEVAGSLITAPGGYTVKLAATGLNNSGETFTRYANTGFNVLKRAVYVYDEDVDTALDYEQLLEARGGFVVDLTPIGQVCSVNFNLYSLILTGPDTGSHYDYDDPDAAGCLNQWLTPILGLGEGGAALFSEYDLNLGYGHTWFSDNHAVVPVAPTTSFWNEPYTIPTRVESVLLYPKPLLELGVYLPDPLKTVFPIAREAKDLDHYSVAGEVAAFSPRQFILWGYNDGPSFMTGDGRSLLVNLATYLAK